MPDTIAIAASLWPVALTVAAVAARDRVRGTRRRRRLNERLHELRRPLQALVLATPVGGIASAQAELAIRALRDLEDAVNGGPPEVRPRAVDARALAEAAAERWRGRCAGSARGIAVRWAGGPTAAWADPVRVAQALDNLLANALEHGSGEIAIHGASRRGRIELAVRDGGARPRPARPRSARDPRHGHGLPATRVLAERQGGRLRLRRARSGTVAVLELPAAPLDPHRV